MGRVLEIIDVISEWSGRAAAFLLLPTIAVMTYEVVVRYIFNAPTIWSAEVITFLVGPLYIFGGVYTLYVRGHINVETLYNMMSPRWQVITRVVLHAPLFFIYIGILLWSGTEFAVSSMLEGEHSGSLWNPIVWPIKMVIPVGAFLMLLQGLSQFLHDIRALLGYEEMRDVSGDELEKEI